MRIEVHHTCIEGSIRGNMVLMVKAKRQVGIEYLVRYGVWSTEHLYCTLYFGCMSEEVLVEGRRTSLSSVTCTP